MFSPVEELLEELRNGKMIVVVDDESRENEGDLIMPADTLRVDDVNFMVTHARGLVCLTLTAEMCDQLQLPLMPQQGQPDHKTNFTVSIEAARGVTTGISAADRTATVKAAVNPGAKPDDIVLPGHIFPIRAEQGGVLVRAGHTEAGCDFARLAGYQASSVIVEILNDDGSMARRDDLHAFAQKHHLKMGTIEDLIEYRTRKEQSVRRINEQKVKTQYGEFKMVVFDDMVHDTAHIAFVKGDIEKDKETLVRVHITNPLFDTYGLIGNTGWPLEDAMKKVANSERGIVVVLREPHTGSSLIDKVDEFFAANSNSDTQSESNYDKPTQIRTFGVGAQILADLHVGKMNVMGAPKRYSGLSAFGLEITNNTTG